MAKRRYLLGGGSVRRRRRRTRRGFGVSASRAKNVFVQHYMRKGLSHRAASALWRRRRMRGRGFFDFIKNTAKSLARPALAAGGRLLGGLTDMYVPGSSALINAGAGKLADIVGSGIRVRGSGIRL